MLTEKDYCDFKTTRELEMLGMNVYTSFCGVEVLKHLLLYEAHKWLMEEKGLHIEIDRVRYEWQVSVVETEKNLCLAVKRHDSYEEALWEGIKEAIKLLKKEK